MPFMAAIPNRAMKPIAAEMLNGVPVTASANIPPISAIGYHAHGDERIFHRFEVQIQKQADKKNADRHHDFEARDGVLQIAELANPFKVISAWQHHLAGSRAFAPRRPRCQGRARAR